MQRPVAHIECPPSELVFIIKTAALYAEDNDPHREMFLRVTEDGVETPASGQGVNQTSYCTLDRSRFAEFSADQTISVLFSIPAVLNWLSWFSDEKTVTVEILGQEGAELGDALRLSGKSQTVRIDCVSDPTILEEVEFWLPDRFTSGGRFTSESGEPAPTRIETSAETLERLITGAERCLGVEQYPLRTADGSLQLALEGENSTLSGTFPSSVEGPDIDNWYGPGFARIIRGIEGQVTVQTGPDMDVAVIAERPDARLRYFTSVLD